MRTSSLLLLITIFFASVGASAEVNCRWLPTLEKPVAEIAAMVEQKSGKKPSVSCGGGKDFKVCHSCVDRISNEDWAKISPMLADPAYREWHRNWHQEENTQSEKLAAQSGSSEDRVHGESFFFMHRELIRSVNANAAALGIPCLKSWTQLPQKPDDPVWPTIEAQRLTLGTAACNSATAEQKSAAARYAQIYESRLGPLSQNFSKQLMALQKITDLEERRTKMAEMKATYEKNRNELKVAVLAELNLTEQQLEDLASCPTPERWASLRTEQKDLADRIARESTPKELRAVDLGTLGARVMRQWHGTLHGMYDFYPAANCERGDSDVRCNNMGDPTQAHTNVHFYQVHGLVDNHIDKWLEANGYETAAQDCTGKEKCFKIGALWMGRMPDYVSGTGCSFGQPLPEELNPDATQ